MDSDNKTTAFGLRLKLARKMAGMSLQDLSNEIGNMVSKQALNKYEQGIMNPTSDVLIALSKALDVSPDYFIKKDTVKLGQISFRKKVSLSKKDQDVVVEKGRNYLERYQEIESILALKNKFCNPLADDLIESFEDVERAALKLRKVWELGLDPIVNLIEMLELRGVKALLLKTVDQVDGFATFAEGSIPLVMINSNEKSIERIRFTIIHELAHILLFLNDKIKTNHKLEEEFCHYFSSCFLVPPKSLIQMIGGQKRSYIRINELINIKEYYGISIRAIVHRLKKIGVITESYYNRWMVYMSKTYGQKNEPGEYKGREESKFFDQLINRALSEGLISNSKAASLSQMSINEFRKKDL